ATHNPDYTFVDTADQFTFTGDTGALTPNFLGADAAGAALTDNNNQGDVIYDAKGFFTAPTAGTSYIGVGDGPTTSPTISSGSTSTATARPGAGRLSPRTAGRGRHHRSAPIRPTPGSPASLCRPARLRSRPSTA